MIYNALGGKGDMPVPPWWREQVEDAAVSQNSVVTGLKALGLNVVVESGHVDRDDKSNT